MIREFINYIGYVKGCSQNTCIAYEKDLHTFVRFIKNHTEKGRWRDINRDDIDAFIVYQIERGMKPATTNRQLSAIQSMYDYMKRQGIFNENPARYESRRKIAKTVPNTIPAEALLKACDLAQGQLKLIVEVLMTTGIRIQECLDLQKCDLNPVTTSIRIKGKGMKERVVYTNELTMKHLREATAKSCHTARIFMGWNQREVRHALWELLRPITDAPQVSPHAIRHSFATNCAQNGMNATTLQLLLGHEDIRTTQKYVDLAQSNVKEQYLQFAAYHS